MYEEGKTKIEEFIEMVKDTKVCMFITSEEGEDNITGRPMGINKIDDDGTMWFFTRKSSHVDELQKCKAVSISVANSDSNNYLMIQGTASLHDDKLKMKELWSSVMKAWFPLGLDDPDMILIKVSPTEVKYWDASSSKMLILFNMVKAIVKGEEYKEGEFGTIKF